MHVKRKSENEISGVRALILHARYILTIVFPSRTTILLFHVNDSLSLFNFERDPPIGRKNASEKVASLRSPTKVGSRYGCITYSHKTARLLVEMLVFADVTYLTV